MADLKPEAIALFKQKALERGRLTIEEANVSNDILMDNLHLVDEDARRAVQQPLFSNCLVVLSF